MATSELKIIDIKSKFDVCEFPIKNSFVALDTSSLIEETHGESYLEDGYYFIENSKLGIVVAEVDEEEAKVAYKEYFLWLFDQYYSEKDDKLSKSGLELKNDIKILQEKLKTIGNTHRNYIKDTEKRRKFVEDSFKELEKFSITDKVRTLFPEDFENNSPVAENPGTS